MSFSRCFVLAGNQGNHENFDTFVLPYEFGLIFMGMEEKKDYKKKIKKAD